MKQAKSLFSVAFCLLIYSGILAKEGNIDSLNQVLVKYINEKNELRKNVSTINDSTIVNIFVQLSAAYCDSNFTKSNDYANQAFNLSKKIGYIKGLTRSYICYGDIYYQQGNFESSNKANKQALVLSIKSKDYQSTLKSYLNLGANSLDLGNYAEALKYYLLALETAEKYKFNEKIAIIYSNIGIVYYYHDKIDKALQNFQYALKYNIENGKKSDEVSNYLGIGAMYDALKNYNEAIRYDFKALTLATEINNKMKISESYKNLALTYFKIANYNEALKYGLKNLELKEEIGAIADIGSSYNALGKIYIGLNKFNEADKYLKKALEIAKKTGSLFEINNSYQFLVINDSARGNYKDALAHYRMHVNTRDSMYNKESTEKMLQAQIKYEFDKKEAAIKSKQAIKDAIAKEKIQQQKIIILTVILGSGLLLFGLLYFINRRRAKHAYEVNKLENKTLRSQLNPHFIFNALASIQKYMNEHPEKAENYLAKFGKLMREVLENSEKEFISLEEEFDMLKNYMDLEKLRVKNGFNYQFNIHENIDVEEVKLPPLLLQPIVENAIWHGVANDEGKGEIIINVGLEEESIKFEIENKSEFEKQHEIAIPESGKRKSFGQQIVRERLNLLSKEKGKKCHLEMLSTPQGMKAIVLIPYFN